MTTDKFAQKKDFERDSLWKTAITDAEKEIAACQERIRSLKKSIVFFNKQENNRIPFPLKGETISKRHSEIS